MKDQFADYETAKMLRALGFNETCIASYRHEKGYEPTPLRMRPDGEKNSIWENLPECQIYTAPLWQQVKQWLIDNHKIWILIGSSTFGKYRMEVHIEHKRAIIDTNDFYSPITAEIEGIKAAIHHLHKKK